MKSTIAIYLADHDKYLGQFRTSIKTNDLKALIQISHKYAGTVSLFYIEKATEYSRGIEESAAQGDLSAAENYFKQLEAISDQIKKDLAAFIERRAAA